MKQLTDLEKETQLIQRNNDFEPAIQKVRDQMNCCKLLAERWDEPFIFTEKLIKRCIGRKLPEEIALTLNDINTTEMNTQQYINEIRHVKISLEEHKEIKRQASGYPRTLVAEDTKSSQPSPSHKKTQNFRDAGNAAGLGTKATNVVTPGGARYVKPLDIQTTAKKKGGSLVTKVRQFPKGGTNVKVREEATQIDLLKTMIEDQDAQTKRLTDVSERAKKKRQEVKEKKRPEREAEEKELKELKAEHSKDTQIQNKRTNDDMDDLEVDIDDDSGEESMIAEAQVNVRLHIYGYINLTKVLWLVDFGSTVSIMAYDTFRKLHNKGTTVSSQTSAISGLGDRTPVETVVNLDVNIGNTHC